MARGLSAAIDPSVFARAGARHELRLTTINEDGGFELAIIRRATGEAVGTVALFAASSGALEVLHLWVAPLFRGYGAGSEAAQLVIAAAAESGFPAVHAWAHPGLGLSVYFWIRMGLQPLHGDGPHDGLRFTRDLGLRAVG